MNQPELTLQQVADLLWQAASQCEPIAPVRTGVLSGSIDLAYRVQDLNTERSLREGHRLVGRKIGLTAKSVQQQLGVSQPDYGMLFADMALVDSEEIHSGRLIQPKVEGEIAFVLGRDLDGDPLMITDVMAAIDYALPAIEIVDSRIQNWDIGIEDTVADNASSGLFMLGTDPHRLAGLDLRLAGMVMNRRGEPVATGAGVACLGHPLIAALWLARKMVEVGRPLQTGDIILSGALGPMVSVMAGDDIELNVSGLGSVRCYFAE